MRERTLAGCVVCLCVASWAVLSCLAVAAEQRPTERVKPPPQCNPNAVVWRTPEPPKNPQAGDIWVNPKDGMEMVYIAAGEFTLGTSDAETDAWLRAHPHDPRGYFDAEKPQCRVRLDGYWIGRTEVTNAQYLRFAKASGHAAPKHWKGGRMPASIKNVPVTYVSWEDARAYCEWAGARLPTELEWEKAARGGDARTFPWGFTWDAEYCLLWSASSKRKGPSPVGSRPGGASPYGCLDMAGNLWEWCADWMDERAYERYASGDLTPPAAGQFRVLRGGSWGDPYPRSFRCATRGPDKLVEDCIGFRYVLDARH